jgi:hypothetical protein
MDGGTDGRMGIQTGEGNKNIPKSFEFLIKKINCGKFMRINNNNNETS